MSTATDTARQHTELAVQALVDVIRDADSKGSEVVAAANALLDRAHGKPMQAIVSVPVPARIAARLAALDDLALLQVISDSKISERGVHPQNGSGDARVTDDRRDLTQVAGGGGTFSDGGGSVTGTRVGRETTRRGALDIVDGELVPIATRLTDAQIVSRETGAPILKRKAPPPMTPFERAMAAAKHADDPLLA